MWRQLFPLALCVATAVWAQTQLPNFQHRGLQVALEDFHKHPPVQWAFHETGVINASDVVRGAALGTPTGKRDRVQQNWLWPINRLWAFVHLSVHRPYLMELL